MNELINNINNAVQLIKHLNLSTFFSIFNTRTHLTGYIIYVVYEMLVRKRRKSSLDLSHALTHETVVLLWH